MLKQCSVTGCTNQSDPRWFVRRPACDSHGEARDEEMGLLRTSIDEAREILQRIVEAHEATLSASGVLRFSGERPGTGLTAAILWLRAHEVVAARRGA